MFDALTRPIPDDPEIQQIQRLMWRAGQAQRAGRIEEARQLASEAHDRLQAKRQAAQRRLTLEHESATLMEQITTLWEQYPDVDTIGALAERVPAAEPLVTRWAAIEDELEQMTPEEERANIATLFRRANDAIAEIDDPNVRAGSELEVRQTLRKAGLE